MRIVALLVAVGCVHGGPAGFPTGDRWTFSLVDPLAEDRLVVPVVVGGRGPYLFVLDPEAPRTVVDSEIVPPDAARYCESTSTGTSIDRASTDCTAAPNGRAHQIGEVTPDVGLDGVRIGQLALDRLRVGVIAAHKLDAADRRISGVLGRDVIDPALVFGFDRDRGIAWLATGRGFHPPDSAHVIGLDEPIRIGGADVHGSVDLGRVESRVANGAVASQITFGGITRTRFPLVPTDGTGEPRLGLGFFRAFALALDRGAGRVYLSARDGSPETRALRLQRWGAAMPRCKSPGCVRLALDRSSLTVSSQAATAALQVVVRATAPGGELLPDVELALPAGSQPVSAELGRRYEGAVLEVVDASPFPRRCPGSDACVIVDRVDTSARASRE